MEQRNDVTVNGGGTVPGGTYENVTINGGGSIDGDVVCTAMRINGAATVRGTVKAASLVVNGAATLEGPVQASAMSVNGDARLLAGLGVGELTVRGNFKVAGGVAARSIDVRGYLRTPGDITTDALTGEGALEANRVTAETVDLGVYGRSEVKELTATRLTLRAPNSFADLLAVFTRNEFSAGSIRANEAWLENTVTGLVSAGNVTVGGGSRVGLVHYSGTFTRRDDAVVSQESKA